MELLSKLAHSEYSLTLRIAFLSRLGNTISAFLIYRNVDRFRFLYASRFINNFISEFINFDMKMFVGIRKETNSYILRISEFINDFFLSN